MVVRKGVSGRYAIYQPTILHFKNYFTQNTVVRFDLRSTNPLRKAFFLREDKMLAGNIIFVVLLKEPAVLKRVEDVSPIV